MQTMSNYTVPQKLTSSFAAADHLPRSSAVSRGWAKSDGRNAAAQLGSVSSGGLKPRANSKNKLAKAGHTDWETVNTCVSISWCLNIALPPTQ